MGDVSVIARRLKDGKIQHGWSGNWGSYRNVGQKLMEWYDNKNMVGYLFSLGQLSNIGAPYSETNERVPAFYGTCLTGKPHWTSATEDGIFTKIAFIDYAYFYEESDEGWYYIAPGSFCIKIPMALIDNNLDEHGNEYKFLDEVRRKVITHLLYDYPKTDPEFSVLLATYDMDNLRKALDTDYPFYTLRRRYRNICDYLDNWVVIVPDAKEEKVADILMRKREEPRMETINWPGHPVHQKEEYMDPAILNCALSCVSVWLTSVIKVIDHNKAHPDEPVAALPCDVPAWFLAQFRAVMDDDDAAVRLLKKHFDDLHGVSSDFDEELSFGCKVGRKQFQEFMAKHETDWGEE